jgi:plastocyanin
MLSSRFGLIVLLMSLIIISAVDNVKATTVNVLFPQGASTPGCESTDSCFQPSSQSVSINDVVIWTNQDTAAHTVTSGNVNTGADGEFDSSIFDPGKPSHTHSMVQNLFLFLFGSSMDD